jgi:mannonate dehydratase
MSDQKNDPSRRDITGMALAGAATLAATAPAAHAKPMIPIPPGLKIGVSANRLSPEYTNYLKQLGVQWLSLAPIQAEATAEGFIKQKAAWEAEGFRIYNIGSGVGPSGSLHNMSEVTLNLPGRDQKIEEYLNDIRYLGKAKVPYSTYAHMGNGIWSSGRVTSARGYSARDGNANSPEWKGVWAGKTFTGPLSHGRVYTEQEIWDNYIYFIKKVKPVAEEAGVRIGIHPDDPPMRMLAGVPRCIFSNFEGYKKAIEIADSPNIGVCFCIGSWLEGGEKNTGADPVEVIKYFAAKKKLFKVHFRNVTAPLPHFVEALIDDGYYDMSKAMQALVDVKFDGIVIPDHIPAVGTNPNQPDTSRGAAQGEYRPHPGLAYLLGSMNAMYKSALRTARA